MPLLPTGTRYLRPTKSPPRVDDNVVRSSGCISHDAVDTAEIVARAASNLHIAVLCRRRQVVGGHISESRPRRVNVLRAGGGRFVDPRLGELSQPFVRCALLVERLLQQVGRLPIAHVPRERARAAVARHFVMLDLLRRVDNGGVADVGIRQSSSTPLGRFLPLRSSRWPLRGYRTACKSGRAGHRKVIGARAAREFRRRQELASERIREMTHASAPARGTPIGTRAVARAGLLAAAIVAAITGRRRG
jgi:hypothetical protein